MKTRHRFIEGERTFFALFAAVALAGSLEAQPMSFEQPGFEETTRFVPRTAMEGPGHRVRPRAYCDGLVATYWVDSRDGRRYQAVGTAQLYQRIAEIYAIAKLREMDSGKEFGAAAGHAAGSTVDAVGKSLSDPGKFFESIPQGASKFFGSLGEGLKGGHSHYEGDAPSNLLGESKAKRLLALKLGVNPYSTNPELQKELDRVGWSRAGGGIGVGLAVGAIPAGAGLGLNMNRNLETQIANEDPDQLNILDRKKLLAVGVPRDAADLLLRHRWYSPVHRAVIAEALASLGPDHGQEAFLRIAARAASEVDADYFQQMAQLIERYNRTESPVGRLERSNRTISFLDAAGVWVFPVPFDYCLWTRSVHERAGRAFAGREPNRPLRLYTTGTLSRTARWECRDAGILVTEGVSLE